MGFVMYKKSVMAGAVLALAAGAAQAQQAGDWVLGMGWMHLMPQDSSDPIHIDQASIAGRSISAPGRIPGDIPETGSTVKNSDTVAFSATRYFTDNWALEGVLGVPPRIRLEGTGVLASYGEIGRARDVSPALVMQYHFGEAKSRLRPYVGLGATYLRFSDIQLSGALDGALLSYAGKLNQAGLLPVRPTDSSTTASLESAWRPVFNAGLTYALDDHWGLMLSVSYIPSKIKADLTSHVQTPAGEMDVKSSTRITLDPIVTYLAVTYRF